MRNFQSFIISAFVLASGSAFANPSDLSINEVPALSAASFNDSYDYDLQKRLRTLSIAYQGGCTSKTLFKLEVVSKKKFEQRTVAKLAVRVFEETSNCRMAKHNEEVVDLNQLLNEQMPILARELANDGSMTFELVPRVTLSSSN